MITTMKIKYETENSSRILEMIKNYNHIFNINYNFMFENDKPSTKQILDNLKTKNNILLDTSFRSSSIFDCKAEINKSKEKKIIFGGKRLFFNRMKGKVSKEEFKLSKLRPLYNVGQAAYHGNTKFQIVDENTILFKPSKQEHFRLNLKSVGKNYQKKLNQLFLFQQTNSLPITYKLDLNYVYISFENDLLEDYKLTSKKKNRIFAIDLNPNYIGWSVVDWKREKEYNLVKSGVISLKELNDYENSLNVSSDNPKKKYITNKRNYEVIQIGYKLVKLANHYKCQIFAMEDLTINSSDKNKGRKFNRLCNNQWCRGKLTNIITKLCSLYKITLQKVVANYSSFVGNLVYRSEKLPDMVLSSIEIGRRSYEFYHQYVIKDKSKEKNIVFDKLENVKDRIIQSLEELNCSVEFNSLSDLYYKLKEMRCNYRFSIDEALAHHSYFSKFFKKAYTKSYYFV